MVALTIPSFKSDLDRLNRRAYARPGALRQSRAATGWLDPGEHQAVSLVAPMMAGAPVLDIGVGGGRTTPLLRAISEDYRGIDYVPAMVASARQRFPDADIREMDARHLEFPDGSFRLVLFSYNGIDSVDVAGRREVLREVHRVLRPGGYFVFSALNRDARKLAGRWPDWQVFRGTGLRPPRLVRAIGKLLMGGINHLRAARLERDDGAVALGNLSAYNYAMVTVFTSLPAEIHQVLGAGFITEAIFDPDGRRLTLPEARGSKAQWHYFVVQRRPDTEGSARPGPRLSSRPGWGLRRRSPAWRRSRRGPA